MRSTQASWRSWLLTVALVVATPVSACGANPSDEALLQANREARDNLKRPPGERSVETLNLNRAAQLAANRRATDDDTARQLPEDPVPLADADDTYQPSTDELDAIAMAQDARLELLNGDAVRGRELLEASLNLHPTVDALEPLAELLAADQDDATLTARCERTREALRADDDAGVIEVLRLCYTHHSSDDVDAALGWASDDDRTRFKAILSP